LSYLSVVTLSNDIAIDPQNIRGDEIFCGNRAWSVSKVVAEIFNGVGWYGFSILRPDPIGIAEV